MKAKHTQGEWWKYQSDSNISILASQGKNDTHIAQIDNNTKEDIANAKLIAAAPELLKCANDFMLAYDSLGKELQAKLYKEYGIEPFGLNTAIKQATE